MNEMNETLSFETEKVYIKLFCIPADRETENVDVCFFERFLRHKDNDSFSGYNSF